MSIDRLVKIKDRSETYWQNFKPAHAGMTGSFWQTGTRWHNQLSIEQIYRVEHESNLKFPPDYIDFLTLMHTTVPKMKGRFYKGDKRVTTETPSFYDWILERSAIQDAVKTMKFRFVADIAGGTWLSEWGKQPADAKIRTKMAKRLIKQMPKLIPVFGHRFLLAEPCVSGNPVFSMYGTDIILYADDLSSYLEAEIGLDRHNPTRHKEFEHLPVIGPLINQ